MGALRGSRRPDALGVATRGAPPTPKGVAGGRRQLGGQDIDAVAMPLRAAQRRCSGVWRAGGGCWLDNREVDASAKGAIHDEGMGTVCVDKESSAAEDDQRGG